MNKFYEIFKYIKANNPNDNLVVICKNGFIKIKNEYTHESYYNEPISNVEVNFEEFGIGSGVLRILSLKVCISSVDKEQCYYMDNEIVNLEIRNINEFISEISKRYGITEKQIIVDIIPNDNFDEI